MIDWVLCKKQMILSLFHVCAMYGTSFYNYINCRSSRKLFQTELFEKNINLHNKTATEGIALKKKLVDITVAFIYRFYIEVYVYPPW